MKEAINQLIEQSHETAKSKGWWEHDRSFGDQVALMHSELSEALEEFRNHPELALRQIYTYARETGELKDREPGDKPEGVAAEFADVLIRIFDTCGRYGIPLADALELKLEYNKTRPHRHGGKAL